MRARADTGACAQVLPGNSDIVAGHNTWRSFYAMMRVYKVFKLAYAPMVSIASSPGAALRCAAARASRSRAARQASCTPRTTFTPRSSWW